MSARYADSQLGALLIRAHRDACPVAVGAALEPDDLDSAYAIQREVLLRRRLDIGGWKVGAKSPTSAPAGDIRCAALPAERITLDPAFLARRSYPFMGLELEIAFTFSRTFVPRPEGYAEHEVLAALSQMAACAEIVSSRVAGWPDVGPLTQLADMQNHGALVVGEMVPYDAHFPFAGVNAELRIDDSVIFSGHGSNPAGDPRRLLPWVVNHCTAQGWTLRAGDVVTTGSYIGMHFPQQGGGAGGTIGTLPPVRLMLM